MKKGTITNIDKKPDFRTNDGKTLFVFELELDNGDKGAIFKQKDNAYVEVGQEITYEITERGTIKIKREGFSNSFKAPANDDRFYSKEEKAQIFDAKDRRISKLAILKCSVELVCNDKIDLSEVQTFSENMLDWVYDKQSTKSLELTDDQAPF